MKEDRQARSFSEGTEELANYFMGHSLEEMGVVRGSPSQKHELYGFTMGMIGHYLELGECKSLKYIRRNFPDDGKKGGKTGRCVSCFFRISLLFCRNSGWNRIVCCGIP